MFPSQVSLNGRSKAKAMAAGGNGGGDNQAARMPTWNQQANMGMGMEGVPTTMNPQMMQLAMMQQPMVIQQQ